MDKNEFNICPNCIELEEWGVTTLDESFKTNLNRIQHGLYDCSLFGISLSPFLSNINIGFLPSSIFPYCLQCTKILITDRNVFDMTFDGEMIPPQNCNVEELTPKITFNISINFLRRNINNFENCVCDMKVFKECTISNNNITYEVSRGLDGIKSLGDRTKPILRKHKYTCYELNGDSNIDDLKIICKNCDKKVHKDEYYIIPHETCLEISFYNYRRMWE